jgi:hypothetical protein
MPGSIQSTFDRYRASQYQRPDAPVGSNKFVDLSRHDAGAMDAG